MNGASVGGNHDELRGAMRDAGIDALVLGQPSDVSFASGVSHLWTSGSRPFGPSCVIVGDDVHVMSTWGAGVPDDIPRTHLFGLSWNPQIVTAALAAIDRLPSAQRIGVAGANPGTERMLRAVAPDAALVDARSLVADLRATKRDDERARIRDACLAAEAACDELVRLAEPGVTGRRLLAHLAIVVGRAGNPVVPDASVAHDLSRGYPHVMTNDPIEAGATLALTPSVRVADVLGTTGRTIVMGGEPSDEQRAVAGVCTDGLAALIGSCVAGAAGGDVMRAFEQATGTSAARLPVPLAYGIGRGVERPVIGFGAGHDSTLPDGAAIVVQSYVGEPHVGGWLERAVVIVDGSSPTRVSGLGSAP